MKSKSASSKNLTIRCFGFTIVCILLFFASACSNTTNDVISSYDEKFPVKIEPNDDRYKPGIGEVGFDPTKMLNDEYFKTTSGVLQLRGPKNAAFYKWELYLQTIVVVNGVKESEKTPVTLPAECFQTGSSETTEYFIVYMPASGIKPGTYVISLTATSKGGERYLDKAALIVYDELFMSSN